MSVELNSHTKRIEDVEVPVHLIGDSAFLLLATLMKPYCSSATMSDEETFDYRLSRTIRRFQPYGYGYKIPAIQLSSYLMI